MKARERDHVDGELSQVCVELPWESQAGRDARHRQRDEMVQIAVGRRGELQGAEADVVQGFIVDAVGLVGVLDELMDRQRRVVRLDDGIANLGRRHHGESIHDAVGEFLAHFRDQKRSQAGSRSAAERVSHLKALKAVTGLGFLSHHIHDGINKFRAFGVMSLRPIVARSRLSEDEVVGTKKPAVSRHP